MGGSSAPGAYNRHTGKEPNQPVLELPKESPPAMTRRHRTSPPLCCHITSFLELFLPFVTLLFPPSLSPLRPFLLILCHPVCLLSPLAPPHLSLFLFSSFHFPSFQSLLFLSLGHSSIFQSLKCLAVALPIPTFRH